MTRRGLFKRIGAIVMAVAIAPEIAFREKLALPEVKLPEPQHFSVESLGATVELYVFNEALSDEQCKKFEGLVIKKYIKKYNL